MGQRELETVSWTAAYIDHKFHIANPIAVNRVLELQQQIEKQKIRIQSGFQINATQSNDQIQKQSTTKHKIAMMSQDQLIPQNTLHNNQHQINEKWSNNNDEAPIFINSKHQQTNKHYPTNIYRIGNPLKTDSQLSRECYTQINQLTVLKAKIEAQRQLVAIQASKYHRLSTHDKRKSSRKQDNDVQINSRRRYKQVVQPRNNNCSRAVSKRNSHEGDDIMSRNSKDNNLFMLAPHQRKSNTYDINEGNKECDYYESINRKSGLVVNHPNDYHIESKNNKESYSLYHANKNRPQQQRSQNSNHHYLIKTKTTKNRYGNDNSQKGRKYKRAVDHDNKSYHTIDQSLDFSTNGYGRSFASRSQISALNGKIKQLQDKLRQVEFKQSLLEQEDQHKDCNTQIKGNNHNQLNNRDNYDNHTINTHEDHHHDNTDPNRHYEQKPTSCDKSISLLRRFKLNLSSSIYQYNYIEDVETQKKQYYQQNKQEIMGKEIKQLKEVIRGLKLERIRQQAIIDEYRNNQSIDRQLSGLNHQQSSLQSSIIVQKKQHMKQQQGESIKNNQLNKRLRYNPQNEQQSIISKHKIQDVRGLRNDQKRGTSQMKSPLIVKTSNLRIQVRRPLRNNVFQSSVNSSYNELESDLASKGENHQRDYSQQHRRNGNGNLLFRGSEQRVQKSQFVNQVQEGLPINSIGKVVPVNQIQESSPIHQTQEGSFTSNSQIDHTQDRNTVKKPSGFIVRQSVRNHRSVPVSKQSSEGQILMPPSLQVDQISLGQIFTVPNLPAAPTKQTPHAQVLSNVYKVCEIFNISFANQKKKAQIYMKKYRNCVIFSLPDNPNTIVWHQSGKFYFGGWETIDGEEKKHGFGYEHLPNKSDYQGEFQNGKRDGNGTRIMANGDVYKGEWKNGDKHGRGIEYRKNNDSYYDGEWAYGKREGQGILKSNNQLYIGQFKKSMKSGRGVEKFASGDIYQGEYAEGQFDGQGNYFWASGPTYTGQFKCGAREGHGKWRSSSDHNAAAYEGEYQANEKSGRGIYYWQNGCKYIGEFVNDLKHGSGTFIYQDGRQIDGQWQNGKLSRINHNPKSTHSQPSQTISQEDVKMMQAPSKQIQRSLLMHLC